MPFLGKVLCGVVHCMDRLASIDFIQDKFGLRVICGDDLIHIGIEENRTRWREELWVQSNEKMNSSHPMYLGQSALPVTN